MAQIQWGQAPEPVSLERVQREYQEKIRVEVTAAVQDWVSLWEADRAADLARYYTDRAILFTAGGEIAETREAIGEIWNAKTADGERLRADVTGTVAGKDIAFATGRLSYQRETDALPQEQAFVMVLEKHYGRWMIRLHALAPSPDHRINLATREGVLRPTRLRSEVPQRARMRIVGEVLLGQTRGPIPEADFHWEYAGGRLGFDLGDALGLFGHYWEETAADVPTADSRNPLRGYGAELRMTTGSLWRLRGFVTLGASRIEGDGAPSDGFFPTEGVGLMFRIFDGVDLQIAARTGLPETEDGRWIQRGYVTSGLTLAVGHRPAWRDAKPPARVTAETGRVGPFVSDALSRWMTALNQGDLEATVSTYHPLGMLLVPNEGTYRGRHGIRTYWGTRSTESDNIELRPTDLSVSDNIAFLTADLFRRDGDGVPQTDPYGRVLSVVEWNAEASEWQIRGQAMVTGLSPDTK